MNSAPLNALNQESHLTLTDMLKILLTKRLPNSTNPNRPSLSYTLYISTATAFSSVTPIYRDINYSWIIRYIHVNRASMFFIWLFIHIGRGLYYGSYTFTEIWNIKTVLLFIVVTRAFVGYVFTVRPNILEESLSSPISYQQYST